MRSDVGSCQRSAPEVSWLTEKLTAAGEFVDLPICDLLPADSPRSKAEDSHHVKVLAETAAVLPPILVHRSTMRVIDGMHRLRAAELRGARTIAARLLDCTQQEAFIIAVKANVAHGLPLSLADRKAAAARVLAAMPQWSDRAIASVSGLSHKTVGAIRRRATGEIPQSGARLGRDGRLRVVPPAPRRPVDDTDTGGERYQDYLTTLLRDPALKLSETGRALLRLLTTRAISLDDWKGILDAVPPHCTRTVAELASHNAKTWQRFTDELKQQSTT
jgi:ParB-like chromosome segregation protein Spo0J